MQIKELSIRGIEFGKGIPKICVPIVAGTEESILYQANEILPHKPDCIELRVDWFDGVGDRDRVLDLLQKLRAILKDTVLLFTFRSKKEGGEAEITPAQYSALCKDVCSSGYIDLLDIEVFMEQGLLTDIAKEAHANQVYVVGSSHDFQKTPSEQELIDRLLWMDASGADIPKIAVMPQDEKDVITLLSATVEYYKHGGMKPIIRMSMNGSGTISRLSGEIFGSALTFATVGTSSAPGQIPIEEVRSVLQILHAHR